MSNKILYVVVIVIIIIAGVFAGQQITKKNDVQPAVSNNIQTNKVNENNTTETNEVENNAVNNEVQNEVENKVEEITKPIDTKANPEEQAKQIVINNWGEDDTVYFSYDGKDKDGKYIICVREKSSTKALYWYYVDIATGTFDIK